MRLSTYHAIKRKQERKEKERFKQKKERKKEKKRLEETRENHEDNVTWMKAWDAWADASVYQHVQFARWTGAGKHT